MAGILGDAEAHPEGLIEGQTGRSSDDCPEFLQFPRPTLRFVPPVPATHPHSTATVIRPTPQTGRRLWKELVVADKLNKSLVVPGTKTQETQTF